MTMMKIAIMKTIMTVILKKITTIIMMTTPTIIAVILMGTIIKTMILISTKPLRDDSNENGCVVE